MDGHLEPAAAPSESKQFQSRTRFGVLALISLGTMINYLDRTILGIAAPGLASDLHIGPTLMGVVFSAFSWTYVVAQIPGGWFLDKFGTKLTYFFSALLWSLFTLVQGTVRGVVSLLGLRLGLGISEAPCFPTNSRVVATWFPEHERAKATAAYTVGEYLGLACFSPLLFWMSQQFGWRSLFLTVGVAGIAFSGTWWKLYRDAASCVPQSKPVPQKRMMLAQVRELLRHRQVWGASIGQFGGNSTLVFFLTWFPTYLAKERHMDWMKVGFNAILPFAAAACGIVLAGWSSDALLKRMQSPNLARKLPIVFGLLGASTIIAANYVNRDDVTIAIFSFAFFCQGMTGLGWTVISDIAPKELMGITGGIFNFFSNMAGVLTPIIIGAIIGRTGSFSYALAYVGAAGLLGAISYIFVLGDVTRIVLD
jgi:ACS family D-galactonate transporter-like MFS transporter